MDMQLAALALRNGYRKIYEEVLPSNPDAVCITLSAIFFCSKTVDHPQTALPSRNFLVVEDCMNAFKTRLECSISCFSAPRRGQCGFLKCSEINMATAGEALLALMGTRNSGQSIRTQNVLAACAIANIVKSSLGPVGLDKMLVDDVGDVIITNDGATILKQLEVEHPAGKVLVELAQLQDEEVGDGTTSVVIIAAELLKAADQLVKDKLHPTTVINGYRLACKEALRYLEKNLSIPTDELGQESILGAARTSMSSKIIGSNADFFSEMVVKAAELVKTVDPSGKVIYPIKAVNVLKAHGKSASESMLIEGYALNCTVASEAMPRKISNPKIACLDFSLQKAKMHLGISVVVEDPEKLEAIRREEMDIVKRRIDKILKAGANVVLTTGGIDDLCLKQFVEVGAMAVRRCKKVDLKRIAKATGATLISSLANLEGDESFEASMLGTCEEIVQERISDDELIFIKKTGARTAASIILRGANDVMLDEMERSVHDALCVCRRVLESKSVVCGGGAVEVALNVYLEAFATSLASREQLPVAAFADALLVIPKTLAKNAAKDSITLCGKLRSFHALANQDPKFKYAGLDLIKGTVADRKSAGVLEPLISKVKSLKFATEAAITILRIDDLIKLDKVEPRGGDECH
uniref:T-complex protein 1 subunit alpha n=1 Tax=Steinernema glaseri TaxID=37863 RepID=A0A1I7YW89_9BILA